jgi:hypothetical protein
MRIPIRLKLAYSEWRNAGGSRVRRLAPLAAAIVGVLPALVSAPSAMADAPVWNVRAVAAPTNLPPGGRGEVLVMVTNLGDMAAPASVAEPIKISATLPAGLKATLISAVPRATQGVPGPRQIACELASLTCEATNRSVLMYASMEIAIHVSVEPNAQSGQPVVMSVSGGGAAPVSVSQPLAVSATPTKFGVERFEVLPLNADGSLDTQAGSHPFQLTTTIGFNQTVEEASPGEGLENGEYIPSGEVVPAPLALPKDQTFSLPPGLIGNPAATPQCPLREFEDGTGAGACPADTAVGVASVDFSYRETLLGGEFQQPLTLIDPVYNLEPSVGEPARFGFSVNIAGEFIPVFLDTSVRTGGDYGVDVSVHNISQIVSLVGAQVSLWGVPSDPRHDLARGACVEREEINVAEDCTETGALKESPFLTLPPSCSGLSDPFTSTVEATTWAQPTSPISSTYALHDSSGTPVGLVGCNRLPFDPSVSVTPDGQSASTPTGLAVGVHVDQRPALNPTGLGEADVKAITVALPAGVQLSPSAADGLQGCSEAQIGFTGVNPQTGADEFTAKLPTPLEPGLNFCPNASKVATVKIKTPLLPNELEGAVYLAAPQNVLAGPLENPFRSLVAMYIVAEDPVSGVLVKLPGTVSPDPVTGQLTATFENIPQLPFEEAALHFFGTDRAPLTTPPSCGTYTTQASFAPSSEEAPSVASSSFEITSGPEGGPCSDPRPFVPGFEAGSTNLQAGAFSSFALTLSRPDADQALGGVEVSLPAGLSGVLSSVKLCGEAQADAGTCGPESLIGETVVSAGLGGDPYTVTGGKVYITTAYGGGEYGLSIVNPAVAGPFVLQEGRPVIIRAAVYVDPHTTALRIVSNPLPTIIDGIPLQIQHVNVTINRPGFTFNPTNCTKAAIDGTLSSSEGASAVVSTPFQVTNCATLAFEPKLAVSTTAKASKAHGASLTVKLVAPAQGPQTSGTPEEANIAMVKVDLPKQLPSRLTTLQKACLAKVFEADPADCPAASVVGHAKAITPILPVPLEGPAYFVSHGGEAFPSLIMVLQGYGTTVDLVGTTFISKAGITSSTFKTVPDAPVSSFELTLPTGPYSALAANLPANAKYSFCGQKLALPTMFLAQNGAEIHEQTPVAIEGCPSSLSFTSSIKKQTLTLSVYAPAAGKITASGKGLGSQTKTAKGQEDLTITLKHNKTTSHNTTLKVVFKPNKGKQQTKTTKLTLKK